MDTAASPTGFPLYHYVAGQLEQAIRAGSLRSGDRLPSVRQLCLQYGVSASTATQAYRFLEDRAMVEARPRSGYFVVPPREPLPEPEIDPRMSRPDFVTPDDMTRAVLLSDVDAKSLPSFCTMPSSCLLPEMRLRQITAHLNRTMPSLTSRYAMAGSEALRQEIARRSLPAGVQLRPEQILITNGCSEALVLALRSVAQAGDTIAVESPTYFMLLETIRSLGMRSLEIPTHPREGLSIDALDFATREPSGSSIKACLVMPNFQNPLGSRMPDEAKRRLVALAAERRFTLIEDDVYADTHFDAERPLALKAFEGECDADVILCSSFSKTVAPGYRVGWMAPGRHFRTAQSLKFGTSLSTALLPQEVLAQFLRSGGYDHHMRRLRAALKLQAQKMSDAVTRYFPPGCKLSRPRGGMILWVEMPPGTDSRRVFQLARREQIGVAPGATFSCSTRFDHFLRLNFGDAWSELMDARLRRLGEIVAAVAAETPTGLQVR